MSSVHLERKEQPYTTVGYRWQGPTAILMDTVNVPPTLGSIKFLTGPLTGSTFQISKAITTIGRDPGNDIVVTDPSISRHHAQIAWNNGAWSIQKIAQQNKVTVNQVDTQQATIKDRDTIGLGAGITFMFTSNAQVSNPTYVSPPPTQTVQVQGAAPQAPQQTFQVSPPSVQPPPSHLSTMAVPPAKQGQPIVDGGTQRAPAGTFSFGSGTAGPSAPTGVPSFEISTNTNRDKPTYPLTKSVINIGRDPSNDIVIDAPVVSGFHFQIVREGGQLVLVHPHPSRQKTLNGLLYQGSHIPGTEQFRKPLARGDIFRIGDEHGTLVTLTFNDGSGASQDIVPEIRPIPLGLPVLTLGRLPNNTVVLNHPQVSGYHARLEQIPGGYRITNLSKTNGTYVNARRVSGSQPLKVGDEIRIGPFKLTYTGTQLTQQDEQNSIRIDALHLIKKGNNNIILINDISLAVPPRKFVALVGGSGAGKSTLLDALNGLRPAQQGVVLYNGQDYYKHLAAFSTQLGYVPQEDIIHRDLTVERALYYAAKLRLPEDFTKEQIKERIDEVLDDVEMKHRRKLLVSKLSGGQRKRVSIALELLANPSVFFLDEPTSGLDPGLDRKMMFLLRRLADKGHTIVLVTHATNNINACDYVCFLAQGGHLAFFGPPNDAKTYFGKTDFAEIYSTLEPSEENPNIPAQAEEKFKASAEYQRYVIQPLNQGPAGRANVLAPTVAVTLPKRGNPWRQFSILSRRYIELLRNDVGNLAILLLQAPVIGLILMGLLFSSGFGTFFTTSVAQCQSQRPVNVGGTNVTWKTCQQLSDLLDTPQGQQFITTQRNKDGSPKTKDQIINDAILPGSGGDAQKILFIMAFAAVMFGCINGAREIVKEAPIYRRERAVNLGIAPYMFSKIVVLGFLCLLQSAILVAMVNVVAPFHQGIFLPIGLEIYITMALTSLAGLMVGLLISAVAPNNDRATSFIPLILIPQVIFSGIVFALTSPLLQVLGGLFAVRWGMAGMGSSVGLHGDKIGGDTFSYQGTLFSGISKTTAVFHLLLVWFVLIAMIVLFGFAIAYFLKKKDVRTQ